MPSVNCAVVGCSNSQYQLRKWKKELCSEHNVTHDKCPCERPFKLFCFPSILRNNEPRMLWIRAMKRENEDRTEWLPKDSDRVCSKHFVDGYPTPAHPLPTIELGYDSNIKKPRRKLTRTFQPPIKRKKLSNNNSNIELDFGDIDDESGPEFDHTVVEHEAVADHSYCKNDSLKKCEDCDSKGHLVSSLVNKINCLSIQVKKLQGDRLYSTRSSTFTWRKIKIDQKMNFYTGIPTIALFKAIFLLLQPFLPNIKYWQGQKRTQSHKLTRHTRNIKLKKLTHRDEFLLTLMRLRLNILNEDLADRFGISSALCSRTFTTWIKIISKILGKALIVWLPRENIIDNLPGCFKKAGLPQMSCYYRLY